MTFTLCVSSSDLYPTLLLSVYHCCPQWSEGSLQKSLPTDTFLFHFFQTFFPSSELWNDSGFLVAPLTLFLIVWYLFSIIFWVSFSCALELPFTVMTTTCQVLRLLSFLLDYKLFLYRITFFFLNLNCFQLFLEGWLVLFSVLYGMAINIQVSPVCQQIMWL